MATAQQVYDTICYDLFEDGGLVLGLLTVPQFISILNDVVSDFCMKTGLIKRVFTQTTFAGQSVYTVPDDIERVDEAFYAGNRLIRSTGATLSNLSRNWRVDQNTNVTQFHEDGLPIKTLEIIPIPKNNGTYINGPNEPDPPHAVYDSFSAMGQNARQLRALSVIGPQSPSSVSFLWGQIPLIPDDICLAYIPFGVLARIYSGDNELREQQAAEFCKAQYREGLALMAEVSGEVVEEQ